MTQVVLTTSCYLCCLCVCCYSRVTRSLAAAKKAKCRRALTASLQPHNAPYWMRHSRTDCANAIPYSNGTAVTADSGALNGIDCETVSSGDDVTARVSQSCDYSTHQNADTRGVSSRSSRLAGSETTCVRSPSAFSRVLESNSNEGHSSGSDAHHRLQCSEAGECCLYTTHNGDSAGQTDCNHSVCLRMSSASTHIDRPWVSICPDELSHLANSEVLVCLSSQKQGLTKFTFGFTV